MSKSAKEYYRNYQADNSWSRLSETMVNLILNEAPSHILEFGSGSGKHLAALKKHFIASCGIDISVTNTMNAHFKNDCSFLILGDETNLRHLCNFDCVFTVSVLDHIPAIAGIINEFKRIANKAVFLAESTKDDADLYYWNHDYFLYGFDRLDFEWKSPADNSIYRIWKWIKPTA